MGLMLMGSSGRWRKWRIASFKGARYTPQGTRLLSWYREAFQMVMGMVIEGRVERVKEELEGL